MASNSVNVEIRNKCNALAEKIDKSLKNLNVSLNMSMWNCV